MTGLNKLFLGLALTLAFASNAKAVGTSNGFLVSLNAFMYDQVDKYDGAAESKASTSIYDIKAGYLTSTGLYFGAIHTSRSVSGTTSIQGSATGASIGYIGSSGFFLKGHYLLAGEYGEMKKGSGYQLDFGYITSVTTHFMVGVEVTHRNMTYEELPGVSGKYNFVETFPMLTVGFVF